MILFVIKEQTAKMSYHEYLTSKLLWQFFMFKKCATFYSFPVQYIKQLLNDQTLEQIKN